MENNIKTFSLFVRQDEKSESIAETVRQLNSNSKTPLREVEDGDLVIAIGGDGTFLNSVTSTNFGQGKVYVGIHTGTLGFLQDLSENDVYTLIKYLSYEKEINVRKVYIPIITVTTHDGKKEEYKAFNEILVCGADYTKIQFSEYIQGEFFQNVTGNGIIISSSAGDTAYNLSVGGAIDFSNHYQLVRTLIAPIKNAAYPDFIVNPIICPEIRIDVEPCSNLQIIIDGISKEIKPEQIKSIEVSMRGGENYINKLTLQKHSKVQIIREKILGYDS